MSVTIILVDNKRLSVKATVNTLLSEILEKACTSKGLDSGSYTLRRNNKATDLSLTLRLAGIPLNSELHLVADESRKGDGQQKVTLCIQFGDKARKMGEFTANETLWKVIETLFAGDEEIHDNNKVLSVNHLNRLFVGKDTLSSTTLKQMGIYSGRIALRLNSRSAGEEVGQKFVENIQFKKPEPIVPTVVKSAEVEVKPEAVLPKADQQPPPTSPTPMDVDSKPSGSSEPTTGFTKVDKKFASQDILTKYLNTKKNKTEAPKEAVVCLNAPKQSKEKQEAKEESGREQTKPDGTLKDEDLHSNVVPLGENQEIFYSYGDSLSEFVDHELPDDFFQHTVSDLRYILKQVQRQITGQTEDNLETRKIKEEKEKQKQAKFEKTLLRIILPYDRVVFQAVFKPMDTIGTVLAVLTKYTKHNKVYLFTTPPKTILSESTTLYQSNLVPNGSLYAGSTEHQEALLKQEYAGKVTPSMSATHFAIVQMKGIYETAKK